MFKIIIFVLKTIIAVDITVIIYCISNLFYLFIKDLLLWLG